jgi:hypothetical protein
MCYATREVFTEIMSVYVRCLCVHFICKKMRSFFINIGVLELQTEAKVHTDINK